MRDNEDRWILTQAQWERLVQLYEDHRIEECERSRLNIDVTIGPVERAERIGLWIRPTLYVTVGVEGMTAS